MFVRLCVCVCEYEYVYVCDYALLTCHAHAHTCTQTHTCTHIKGRVHAVYMYDTTTHFADLAVLGVPGGLSPQEDGEGGGLGPLGDVNDLLQPGDPEGHVLGGHAGVVEGVEGHLGGRFSQRLGGQGPHHLPRLGLHGRGGCGVS